jgi:polyisoprenoid-binding protein YceI
VKEVTYSREKAMGTELSSNTLGNPMKKSAALVIFTLLLFAAGKASGDSYARPIDRAHSTIKVYVYKSGILSTLAHDHEIEAPIEQGEVTGSAASPVVDVRVGSRALRVLDAEVSADTRAKIQATMLGAEVLDVSRFPEIHFQSTSVEPSGANHWMVHGNLELHGQNHPVSFEVTLQDGFYAGTALLKQSEFGITPVKLAGGTIRVKDEIKVMFSIALGP